MRIFLLLFLLVSSGAEPSPPPPPLEGALFCFVFCLSAPSKKKKKKKKKIVSRTLVISCQLWGLHGYYRVYLHGYYEFYGPTFFRENRLMWLLRGHTYIIIRAGVTVALYCDENVHPKLIHVPQGLWLWRIRMQTFKYLNNSPG